MKAEKYIKNYINGTLKPAVSGEYLDNYNPSNGSIYSYIPDSDSRDVDEAVKAAKAAYPEWAALGRKRRFRILMRIADIIEQNLEAFAHAERIVGRREMWLWRGRGLVCTGIRCTW